MPKKIWHELSCGAMHRFLEHRYSDIAPIDFILENFPKEEVLKVTNPYNVGFKKLKVAEKVNSAIIMKFWTKAMDRLMESEIMEIDKYTSMYIGITGTKNDGRGVKYRKNKLTYLHQKAIYGVVLNGFFHNYYFLMPFRRRKELYERLKNGQNFVS